MPVTSLSDTKYRCRRILNRNKNCYNIYRSYQHFLYFGCLLNNYKLMRKFFLMMGLIGLAATASAQDPNFSQFFVSPLTLNPAMTGKFNGDFRLAGNYRDQWPAITKAFITSTASFDMGILKSR